MNQEGKKATDYVSRGLRLGLLAVMAKCSVNGYHLNKADQQIRETNQQITATIEHIRQNRHALDSPLWDASYSRPVVYLDVQRVGTPNPHCGTTTRILYDKSSERAREYAEIMGRGPCWSTEPKESTYFVQTNKRDRRIAQAINGLQGSYLRNDSLPIVEWKDVYIAAKAKLTR